MSVDPDDDGTIRSAFERYRRPAPSTRGRAARILAPGPDSSRGELRRGIGVAIAFATVFGLQLVTSRVWYDVVVWGAVVACYAGVAIERIVRLRRGRYDTTRDDERHGRR